MKKLLALIALITGMVPAVSFAEDITSTEINRPALGAANYTQVLDVSGYDRFSMQVVYGSATLSAATVLDGAFSTATITVTDYTQLNAQPSTATLTLVNGKNTTAIDGAVITINGRTYTEGVHWARGFSSTNTMASLATALDAHGDYSASASSNVVTLTAYANGTFANSWTITSSTQAAISTGTWSGGKNAGYLFINGVTLTEGVDFDAATSAQVTANNIEEAINGNTTLAAVITATNSASGKVTLNADTTGINAYPISVSNTAHLTPNNLTMVSGTASDISVADDTITETNHGFGIGLNVLFQKSAGTDPTGLTSGTTYFAIPVNANTFKVATTSTGAVAESAVNITAITGGGSFTFTPIAFSVGSAGFKWQGSNDGTNFSDLSVSSVTYSAHGNTLWSFLDYTYKYLRLYFTGPTRGGITLTGTLFGRRK